MKLNIPAKYLPGRLFVLMVLTSTLRVGNKATSDNHSVWPGGSTKVLLKNQQPLLQAIYIVLQLCHFEFLQNMDNSLHGILECDKNLFMYIL